MDASLEKINEQILNNCGVFIRRMVRRMIEKGLMRRQRRIIERTDVGVLREEIFVGIGRGFVVREREIGQIPGRSLFDGGETIVIGRTKETKEFGQDEEEKSDGNENENEQKGEEQFRIVSFRSHAHLEGDLRRAEGVARRTEVFVLVAHLHFQDEQLQIE